MPQPVTYNPGIPVSGSIQENNISYVVDGQNRNYRGGFGGLSWMSEVPAANNVIFIGNSVSLGRGPANIPLFYPSYNNSAANIIYAANTLPGSPRNFTTTSSAYNWAATNNFFINNSNNPIPRIDADSLSFYMDAGQPTSYPQTGTNWLDLSGNGNNGALINGPTWSSNGWFTFDGVDDYVNCGIPITFTNSFSLNFYFKTTTSGVLLIFGMYNGSGADWWIGTLPNGTLNFSFGSPSKSDIATSTVVTDGLWRMATCTYNKGANSIFLYLNGDLQNSSNTIPSTVIQPGGNMSIGRFGDLGAFYWPGSMANTQLYSKTLTQTEIKQNYFQSNIVQDGLVFMVDANNLVSYPKSGTTWYNLTGSSGNALFYNGPTYLPQYGGGINRDNTDDFISASISVSTTTNYSVETWFKANPLTGANYNALISAWNAPGGGAGSWEWQFYNGVLGVHPNYTVAYTPNTIAHAVYTQNGTETKIYLNGILQQTSTTSGVDLRNGSIGIGNLSAPGYGGYNLESTFYNVRLYNKTLTSDEVQQNYQATKDKFLGQNIVTNGLVLNLDSANKDSYPGTGTTWTNLSGGGYNGTLQNGPTFLSNVNGGIFSFDGTDDYVTTSNTGMLTNGTGNFSYGVWVNFQGKPTFGTIFENGLYTAGILIRYYGPDDGIQIYAQNAYYGVYSLTPSLNTWYYLSFVRNGNFLDFYVNGIYQTALGFTANIFYDPNLFIGTSQHATWQTFNGYIPVAQIYNRGLSATEVLQNYNAQKTRFGL
jgi:hypothetical protein